MNPDQNLGGGTCPHAPPPGPPINMAMLYYYHHRNAINRERRIRDKINLLEEFNGVEVKSLLLFEKHNVLRPIHTSPARPRPSPAPAHAYWLLLWKFQINVILISRAKCCSVCTNREKNIIKMCIFYCMYTICVPYVLYVYCCIMYTTVVLAV